MSPIEKVFEELVEAARAQGQAEAYTVVCLLLERIAEDMNKGDPVFVRLLRDLAAQFATDANQACPGLLDKVRAARERGSPPNYRG